MYRLNQSIGDIHSLREKFTEFCAETIFLKLDECVGSVPELSTLPERGTADKF